jgi:Asp/Glu/hydantoin racemase
LPSTEVDVAYCPDAPESYHNALDVKRAIPLVVEHAIRAESNGYDAMLVACMMDPGVLEASRAVRMPVIGLGQATRQIAQLLGKRPEGIYPACIHVTELSDDSVDTYEKLVVAGKRKIRTRGSDVLIPECAYLGRLAPRLQADLGVPVLPNEDIGLKTPEMIAVFGLAREQAWVAADRSDRYSIGLTRLAATVHRALLRALRGLRG